MRRRRRASAASWPLDLTQAAARAEEPLHLPARFELCGGVAAAATDWAASWRVLALFADRATERVDAAAFFGRNPVQGVKLAVLLDREAEGLTGEELLWLAAADSDPPARPVARRRYRRARRPQQTPGGGGMPRAVPQCGRRLARDGGPGRRPLGRIRTGRADGLAVGALPPSVVVG